MSEERAKQTSEQLQLDIKDYIEECKEALTTRSGKRDISYLIEDGCFVWKKLIDSDSGIKVKLGSVVVQPAVFDEVIKNVFNFLIENTNHLEDEVKDLKKQILSLEAINCEMLKNIETMTKTKNSMESVLYSCFSEILNTKKRKIIELESIIRIEKQGTSSELKPTVVSNTEDDCYNVETDSDSAVEENPETERKQQIYKRQEGKKKSLNDSKKSKSNRTVIAAIPSTSSKSRNKASVARTDKSTAHSSSKSHKRVSGTLKNDIDQISIKESNSEDVIQSKKKKNNENISNDSDATISDDSLLNYPTTSIGVTVDSPEVQDNIHNLAIQKKLDKDNNHKQPVSVSNSKQKEQETVATDNVLPESSSLPLKSTDLLDFFYGSDKNVLLPKKGISSTKKTSTVVLDDPSRSSKSTAEQILEGLF